MRYNDRKRKITISDVNNFTINIEAVMDSKEAMPYFVKFLHDTKNGENANFLKDISEFRDIRHDKGRKEKADYIIKMYIGEEAPHELNIGNNLKSSIINYDNCRRNMFDELEYHIVSSMKEHIFPLFLKSKLFASFIESSVLDTLYQIGSTNEGSLLYYIDKLSNLRDEYITWSDVNFVESQMSDMNLDGWELLNKGKNYRCLYSKNSYNIGDANGLNFFKYYIDIDRDAETCASVFKEQKYRLILDKNLVSVENVAYLVPKNKDQLYTTITRDEYKIMYPFENREFVCSASGLKRGKDTMIVMKTSSYDVPPKNKVVRCSSLGAWKFEDMGNNKTRFCQFYCIDFKVTIPNTIMKMLLKKRAKYFYTKAKDVLDKITDTSCVSISDNNMGKTLFDNYNEINSEESK